MFILKYPALLRKQPTILWYKSHPQEQVPSMNCDSDIGTMATVVGSNSAARNQSHCILTWLFFLQKTNLVHKTALFK